MCVCGGGVAKGQDNAEIDNCKNAPFSKAEERKDKREVSWTPDQENLTEIRTYSFQQGAGIIEAPISDQDALEAEWESKCLDDPDFQQFFIWVKQHQKEINRREVEYKALKVLV